MWDANVGDDRAGPRRREAAGDATGSSTSRRSTSSATPTGAMVDETYRRDLADGFLSWYDETKYRAHEVAEQRIAAGAPIVIVHARPGLRPGRPLADRRAARRRLRGTLPYLGPRRRRHSAASTSTTWPPASSRRSTAARSAEAVRPGRRAARRWRRRSTIAARVGGHRPPRLTGSRPASCGRSARSTTGSAAARACRPTCARSITRRPASRTGRRRAKADARARASRRGRLERRGSLDTFGAA